MLAWLGQVDYFMFIDPPLSPTIWFKEWEFPVLSVSMQNVISTLFRVYWVQVNVAPTLKGLSYLGQDWKDPFHPYTVGSIYQPLYRECTGCFLLEYQHG